MKKHILLCEDEKNIVSFLQAELAHANYETSVAYDGEEAVSLFSKQKFDLVLLDLMLPKKNGLEVLSFIRNASDTPVIIVTARKDTFDKVLLLKSGADDYVTKPFDTMELLARISRNIERSKQNQNITVKELSIHYDGFTAQINDKPLALTKTEFEILYFLVQNADKVLTREQLMGKLVGDFLGSSNIVDVNIKNIRKKIAELTSHDYIETVRGKGYVMRR